MNDKNISRKVLDKIKEDNIEPKPKWHFLLKDCFLRAFGIIALNLGGLAVSVIIYLLKNNDLQIYSHLYDSFWSFLLLTIPYFWIILFILFIFIIKYNIKHTKKGYKIQFYKIIFGVLAISVILGAFFYNIGIAQILESLLQKRVPIYREILNPHFKKWMQPDKGFLAGTVIEVENDKVILEDFKNNNWEVEIKEAFLPEKLTQQDLDLLKGKGIRIIGEKTDNDKFNALRIMPLMPPKFKKEIFRKGIPTKFERKINYLRINR